MDIEKMTKFNPKLTLSQRQMAMAVEYYLNGVIFKEPCRVIEMEESRINNSSTFEVKLRFVGKNE